MIDLDNFKEINDRFGHPAGDAALFHAAQTMRSMLRSGDELVRYGGDEFFLLFHGLPAHVLARKLEDICRAVAALTIPEYPDLHLSLSIGGAYGSARVSELVGKADLLCTAPSAPKTAPSCMRNKPYCTGIRREYP